MDNRGIEGVSRHNEDILLTFKVRKTGIVVLLTSYLVGKTGSLRGVKATGAKS